MAADTPLLWALRDDLGLTGDQVRLRHGAVRRLHRAPQRPGRALLHDAGVGRGNMQVTTIEGLGAAAATAAEGVGRLGVPQCGYCQAGPDHDRRGVPQAQPEAHRRRDRRRHGGNICRCGTYVRIRAAIKQAAASRSEGMNAPSLPKSPVRPTAVLLLANVSRRRFVQGLSALGGLVLAVGWPAAARAADPPKYGADGMPNGWVDNPLVFVAIGEDGTVTIVCHRSEMGQGVRTGMPMIVADELEADWKRVRVQQAPGTSSVTATRTPMGLEARAISSSPCAVVAPPRAPCSRPRRPRAGGCPSPRWRRGTTRSCIVPPAGAPATDRSPRPPPACPSPRGRRCASRIRRSSATSARAS